MESKDKDDPSSLMLCKSCFMTWKYFSSDLAEARRVEAWDRWARNLDWGCGYII
jgi:hypothetical protein